MEASNRPGHPSSPLEYTHLYLVDSFHEERGDKIRVTTDEKTGKVVECLRKKRLGNIDIYSPVRAADWRVSVNVEMPGKLYLASHSVCHLLMHFFLRQPLFPTVLLLTHAEKTA